MGRVIRSIGRVFTGAVSGFLGGGPLGAIMGGVGSLFGKGGISALANPIKMFGDAAKGILGKLGNLGLGGLQRPPAPAGLVPMPYPQPTLVPGSSSGGPQLTGSESKLIDRFGGLEKQMNGLLDKLNKGENMSQAELAQIQTQLSKISNMMKQITEILNQIQDTMKNIIQNIRA